MAEAVIKPTLDCTHEKDLRFAYLFARAGYGNIVTFTCHDCGKQVTERFRPESPYRNWTTPDYEHPWANAGGRRRPEIADQLARRQVLEVA